jgi:hypothetical protein
MSCRLPRGASPRSDRADHDCHAAGINPKLGVAAWLSAIARVIATWLTAVAVRVLKTLDAIPRGRGLVGGSDDDNGDEGGKVVAALRHWPTHPVRLFARGPGQPTWTVPGPGQWVRAEMRIYGTASQNADTARETL